MKRTLFLLLLSLLPLLASASSAAKETLQVRILTDPTSIYSGDSMLVSVVLYSSAPVASASCEGKISIDGKCKVRQLPVDRQGTAGKVREGQSIYYTLVWAQYVVAPLQAGRVTIPPIRFNATLQRVVRMPDFFDQMMGARPEYKETKVSATSAPFVVEIKDKPLRSTQEMMRRGSSVL